MRTDRNRLTRIFNDLAEGGKIQVPLDRSEIPCRVAEVHGEVYRIGVIGLTGAWPHT